MKSEVNREIRNPGSSAVPKINRTHTNKKRIHELFGNINKNKLIFALKTIINNINMLNLFNILKLMIENIIECMHCIVKSILLPILLYMLYCIRNDVTIFIDVLYVWCLFMIGFYFLFTVFCEKCMAVFYIVERVPKI